MNLEISKLKQPEFDEVKKVGIKDIWRYISAVRIGISPPRRKLDDLVE